MAWTTSDRRTRLPDDWPVRRGRVKSRAKDRCEARTHARGCDGIGTECDHIIANDDHSLANLQWLSAPCHKAKTTADNAAARRAREAMRVRPSEAHPGTL